jgi:3-oxoadipate enol-lactonase
LILMSTGDVSLNVVDRGTGPVLLFVHGFPLDHSMWTNQIDTLASHYRVIAPDLRGFGQSDGADGTLTMTLLARDLVRLLDALDIRSRIVLCGLSMGGYVALQFWKRYPTRLRGLVLCDTRAAADTPEAAANRHAMAEKVLQDGSQVAADAMMPKLFAPNFEQSEPEILDATRNVILSTAPETIAAAQRGMAERPEMRGELANIKLPTLVICGEKDVISPPDELREMASAIPGSRFEIIPDAGHMSPLESPDAFNDVLTDWLAKLS